VALMHHPLEWLNSIERSNIKAKLQENIDFVLRGHLHEDEVETVASAQGSALYMQAGAAYDTGSGRTGPFTAQLKRTAQKFFP